MADFKRVLITQDGQQLMSDVISGKKQIRFTRLIVSETQIGSIEDLKENEQNYSSELVSLTSFDPINQETTELNVHTLESFGGMTNPAVEVVASIDNTQLTKGYYMRSLGLCADDGQGEEILYAYTYADQPGYMPPYNGKTTSGALFKITVTVGNTDQVTLLQGSSYASSYEVEEVRNQLNDLQTIVGYNESDVFGLEADFENNQFTRLAGAKNLTAGKDFDNLGPWKRRRCMIDYKTGGVVAYEGDSNFSEKGILARPVTGVDGKSYSNQVPYAVMVEQPKFYYRVVPVKTTDHGNGTFALDKARYYISSTPRIGFKVHPAFVKDNEELDNIYIAAYGSFGGDYVLDTTPDGQSNKMSILFSNKTLNASAAKPSYYEEKVQNMQKLNTNWSLGSFKTYAMTELLYVIEYGRFNEWALQNPRGTLANYRGEADLDSIILFDRKYSVTNGEVTIFNMDGTKKLSMFHPNSYGYISRFRYTENDDWTFYPIMNQGTSQAPIGSTYNYGSFPEKGYLIVDSEPFGISLLAPSSALNGNARLVFINN